MQHEVPPADLRVMSEGIGSDLMGPFHREELQEDPRGGQSCD
jgi:hypothetical protein